MNCKHRLPCHFQISNVKAMNYSQLTTYADKPWFSFNTRWRPNSLSANPTMLTSLQGIPKQFHQLKWHFLWFFLSFHQPIPKCSIPQVLPTQNEWLKKKNTEAPLQFQIAQPSKVSQKLIWIPRMQAETGLHTHMNCKPGAAYNCQICNLTLQGISKNAYKINSRYNFLWWNQLLENHKKQRKTYEFQARVSL